MRIKQLIEAVNNLKIKVDVPNVMLDHQDLFTEQDWKRVAVQGFGLVAGDQFGIEVTGGEFDGDSFVIALGTVTPTTEFMTNVQSLYDQWNNQVFGIQELYELTHLSDDSQDLVFLIDKPVLLRAYEDAVRVALNVDKSINIDVLGLEYNRNNHTVTIQTNTTVTSELYGKLTDKLNEMCAMAGSIPVGPAYRELMARFTKKIQEIFPDQRPNAVLGTLLINSPSSYAIEKMEEAGIDYSSYSSMFLGLGMTSEEFEIVKAHMQVDDEGNDA